MKRCENDARTVHWGWGVGWGGGKENRTFAVCLSSNIPLCLVKERIYFPICLVKERICLQKHHI